MTKYSGTCECKGLIVQLLESMKEQSRLLTAQNEVMGKLVDQNTELMNQIMFDEEAEADPNKSLDG
ncbi:hypothetical protein [Acinetobacter guillouiae]|jgi:hypothetical protein|uniref:hypothetical protein n=1 Tax=Acinetobacter guillouiae TaxID=106649 RepID=UPI003CFDD933